MIRSTLVCLVLSCSFTFLFSTPLKASAENIARGHLVTFSRTPNYSLSATPADAPIVLTDGFHADPDTSFWTQKTTVGWQHLRRPLHLTIDLGERQPISGAALSTAGGRAGVTLPLSMAVSVSDDGENFVFVGDLGRLAKGDLPTGYGQSRRHVFQSRKMKAAGRYVRFSVVPTGLFFMTDELEIYRGPDTWLQDTPEGPPLSDELLTDPQRLTQLGIYRRLRSDLEEIRHEVTSADTASEALLRELAGFQEELEHDATPVNLETFRAIFPLSDLHARILAVRGKLAEAAQKPPLQIWHSDRYDLSATLASSPTPVRQLNMQLARRDPRSEILHLTNHSGEPQQARITIEDLPREHLRLYTVATVDHRTGRPTPGALLPVTVPDGPVDLVLPAGITTSLWLTFELPAEYPAGKVQGRLSIESNQTSSPHTVALNLEVAPITLPEQPVLHQTLWDYAADHMYGITQANQQAAIEVMAEAKIDTFWAAPRRAPLPERSHFDGEGNLRQPIDYAAFDAFIDRFPQAAHYMVFGNIQGSFAGFEVETPAYDRAVAQWAADWARHLRERGIASGRVILLPYDEPGNDIAYRRAMASAKAFRQGTRDILLFSTTSASFVRSDTGREAMSHYDILCPTLAHLDSLNAREKAYLQELRQQGQQLWIYMCNSGMEADPSYFRLQPWFAWSVGAVGSGFWALGDTGTLKDQVTDSWNEYPAVGRHSYTPVFLGNREVALSRHWMAMVEGVRDYDYLHLLKERVEHLEATGSNHPHLREARRQCDTLAGRMFQETKQQFGPHYASDWKDSSRLAEAARLQLLECLTLLADGAN